MPAHFEIACHALERLMRLAQQRFFFFRGLAKIKLRIIEGRGVAQPPRMRIDQPINAIQETRASFDRLLAPFEIFLRWRSKQCVETSRVAAILLRHLNRADNVSARF